MKTNQVINPILIIAGGKAAAAITVACTCRVFQCYFSIKKRLIPMKPLDPSRFKGFFFRFSVFSCQFSVHKLPTAN